MKGVEITVTILTHNKDTKASIFPEPGKKKSETDIWGENEAGSCNATYLPKPRSNCTAALRRVSTTRLYHLI